MKATLRILLAEGRTADAELIENEIRGAYEPAIGRVQNAASMTRALQEKGWDLVISDYDMPGFSGLDALKLVRESRPDLPFIMISGRAGEEFAVEAMRAGADDYVTRSDLSRLPSAIERSQREAATRATIMDVEEQLIEHRARLEGLVSHFPGVVFQVVAGPAGTYKFSHVSAGAIELLELPAERLEADAGAFFALLLDAGTETFAADMKRSGDTMTAVNWEGRLQTPESAMVKWVNIRLKPRRMADGKIAWEGFMANITNSKQHELEITESRRRLSELSSHLEDVKEQERARIARELHDDIGGNLTAIKIDVLWLAERNAKDARAREKLTALEALVDETAAAITRIGQDLRPGILDLGLVAAIEWQATDFSNRTGVKSAVTVKCDGLQLESNTEMALFSIFRETLTNIAKHANAKRVEIGLDCDENDVELTVVDNGKGIAPADRLKPTSFGLRGMEERAAQLGGTVKFTAARPRGTRVRVRVPRRASGHGA
jgi:two-component system, NarL family, sensor histidine kinase UhpB